MRGQFMLWRDQYGQSFTASTLTELRDKVGGGKIEKMYQDSADRTKSYHTGYVIGRHWLTGYIPMRNER